jgi:hypothetical protein
MTFIQTLAENPNWLIPVLIWTLIWKGTALWKCGQHNQIRWFIAILILNTLGSLPIVYLIWFRRDKNK